MQHGEKSIFGAFLYIHFDGRNSLDAHMCTFSACDSSLHSLVFEANCACSFINYYFPFWLHCYCLLVYLLWLIINQKINKAKKLDCLGLAWKPWKCDTSDHLVPFSLFSAVCLYSGMLGIFVSTLLLQHTATASQPKTSVLCLISNIYFLSFLM